MATPGGDANAQLRRWTVIVLLGLLIFVTLAPTVLDDFHAEPAFFGLVGGMIAGLFVAEGVGLFKRNKDE